MDPSNVFSVHTIIGNGEAAISSTNLIRESTGLTIPTIERGETLTDFTGGSRENTQADVYDEEKENDTDVHYVHPLVNLPAEFSIL